jgi:hypothetical protein
VACSATASTGRQEEVQNLSRRLAFQDKEQLRKPYVRANLPGMHLAPSASHTDAINARILAVSEDRIQGFVRDPMAEIARRCKLPVETVIERIRAMLRGGTIRRVRQTLMATDLAPGALVAWEVDRHAGERIAIQALDHAEGAARFFDGEARRLPARARGRA